MLDKDKAVQGYVIYAEFRTPAEISNAQTRQVFFTPDGFTTSGTFVPMRAHYRTVAATSPRKQWSTTTTNSRDVAEVLEAADMGEYYSLAPFTEEWAHSRLIIIHRYFDHMMSYNWKPVGTPLVVEASKHDMDDIAAIKTPTKIIYRINQSRTAAGFPAELF